MSKNVVRKNKKKRVAKAEIVSKNESKIYNLKYTNYEHQRRKLKKW